MYSDENQRTAGRCVEAGAEALAAASVPTTVHLVFLSLRSISEYSSFFVGSKEKAFLTAKNELRYLKNDFLQGPKRRKKKKEKVSWYRRHPDA